MIRAIVFHERLNFLHRGPAWIVAIIAVAALGYAGWSGDQWRDAQQHSVEAYAAQKTQSLSRWRAKLVAIETGSVEASPYDANPMSITLPAVLPPASLADFATGHADLQPASADISPWRNGASVFGRYQFDNPTTLSSSSFDVAFVVIVLMPLLMIAISFDVLATDRQRGSLSMIMATSVSASTLLWTRLAFRNGLLWLVAVAFMTLLAALQDSGGDRYARFLLWLAISLCYGCVWISIIAYSVARVRSPSGTAGVLVGVWLLFTLAMPAGIASLSEALYPTPSRLAYLSEIRTAQGETNRNLANLTDEFLMDHPELTVGDESVPAYYRAAFLSNEAARTATAPILEAYDTARQGREGTVGWAQFLSPSVIAQRLLMMSAGADLQRQHRFQTQVQDALSQLAAAVGPAVVSRSRITAQEFDLLEPFSFADIKPKDMFLQAGGPFLFLILLSILLGALAQKAVSRMEITT